ncbi:MAG TPA: hypothetical protein VGI10_11460 [Polyangiaceae bacterium]|jgi:hypothetical protein
MIWRAACAFAFGLVTALYARNAAACSCGVPGLESALTRPDETWGVRIAETQSFAHGQWNARGAYRALGAGEHDRTFELLALAALRPTSRLELSVDGRYGERSLSNATSTAAVRGADDLLFHARFELLRESMPWAPGIRLPALALIGSLRAPTAARADGLSLGLGTWEYALGAAVEQSIGRFRLGALAEVADRASDTSLGVERTLGPRALGQLVAWYWPDPRLVVSASTSLTWEGDASVQGRSAPGSGTRLWLVGVGSSFRAVGSNVRPGIALRYAPPAPDVGINVVGGAAVELSVAYTR